VFCKKCGHENEDDALYCENCGADLSSPQPSGMSKTNKILIIVVVVLIASVGLTAGILLTSKSPVTNNTTDNTSVTGTDPKTTTTTSNDPKTTTTTSNDPKLIDTGSTSGSDSSSGPFSFEWKTFEVDKDNLIIYSTYTIDSRSVKQTSTLKKFDDMRVEIFVEPKASGKSSYDTVTTMYGANTVVDYYWEHLRSNVLMKGPIR